MADNPLSEGAFSAKLQGVAEGLDEGLEEIFGERRGFIFITFPFDRNTTEIQYVANCERENGKRIISDLLDRWRRNLPDVPTHKKQ